MVSLKAGLHRHAFTLIELMVVVGIIAILSAILGPCLYNAKAAARRSTCAFNLRQMGIGVLSYIQDYDSCFPQTKGHFTQHPNIDDASGSIELPDYGSPMRHLGSYTTGLADCPSDPDPDGTMNCASVPNANPQMSSYLANGYFVWGFYEFQLGSTSETVFLAERRSYWIKTTPPNCDVIFRPWYFSGNPHAPQDDMDPVKGAIATKRHGDGANYLFADDHCATLTFSQVWSPPDHDMFTPHIN